MQPSVVFPDWRRLAFSAVPGLESLRLFTKTASFPNVAMIVSKDIRKNWWEVSSTLVLLS
jgi:hypothetical protein